MGRRDGWMRVEIMRPLVWVLLVGGSLGGACGGDSAQGRSCTRTDQCPGGFICSLGRCVENLNLPPPPSAMDAGAQDSGHPGESVDGSIPCTRPPTCAEQGAECGTLFNACGSTECGECPTPDTCGGGGVPYRCGHGSNVCTPATCAQLNAECGNAGDGCGGVLQCGDCPPLYTCDTNRCGCEAKTCESLNAECGQGIPDGCGHTLDCGRCTAPETCGGAGGAYKCGCTRRSGATPWATGTRALSTSSWAGGDHVYALDNELAVFRVSRECGGHDDEYIGPLTRTSNHLDIRGFNVKVPTGATLTGVEARVKQSGARIVEAVVFTALGGSPNQGQGRVAGGFHYYGGPQNLFGRALEGHHTNSAYHWGLAIRVQVTAPRVQCRGAVTGTSATSKVDVIQLRAHYEICD